MPNHFSRISHNNHFMFYKNKKFHFTCLKKVEIISYQENYRARAEGKNVWKGFDPINGSGTHLCWSPWPFFKLRQKVSRCLWGLKTGCRQSSFGNGILFKWCQWNDFITFLSCWYVGIHTEKFPPGFPKGLPVPNHGETGHKSIMTHSSLLH